jgi:hypothetical protein
VDEIRAGQIVLFYLFDVSDTIDLPQISRMIGGTTAARLQPKQPTPAYIQYDKPPLSFEGDVVGLERCGRLPAARPPVRIRAWCRSRWRGRSAGCGAIWSASARR